MFGDDPYLTERLMAMHADAVRHEAQSLGAVSLNLPARRLARRLSVTMVTLGGRLVGAGLPLYPIGTGGNAGHGASRGEAPA